MTTENMLWEFLPSGLKGVFNIFKVEKLSGSFHVWLDEIRQNSPWCSPVSSHAQMQMAR